MDINWTSVLTGIAGGIIPAAVAYFMGKRSVKTSLQINEQNLIANKENLLFQLENQNKIRQEQYRIELEKMNYEERRKAILEFFDLTNPDHLFEHAHDLAKLERLKSQIFIMCSSDYFSYINVLVTFTILNPEMLTFRELWSNVNEGGMNPDNDLGTNLTKIIGKYRYHYDQAWGATKRLFNGEQVAATDVPLDSLKVTS